MRTSFFLLACFSTTSVPCTFVSMVWTGASTIGFTPTAAARWATVSRAVDELREERLVRDGVDGVVEPGMRLQMRDVLDGTG